MNSPSYDGFSFHLLSESYSMCGFPESGSLFPEIQTLDTISNDVCNNVWLNDGKCTSTLLTPQRKKKAKLSKKSSSFEYFSKEHFVTKTKDHYFKFKDDFLLDVDKELPDVILASPCKENICESSLPRDQYFNNKHVTDSNSTLLPYDDNPNVSFEDVLRKVQREMDLRNDSVTNEDIEYLEGLLAGIVDQPSNEISPQTTAVLETKQVNCSSKPSGFNEISCNLNSQQTRVSDSHSAIKKLLKSDSFKGNFEKKKSTEILSEMDQSNDHIFEHNYSVVHNPHKIRFFERYPDYLLANGNNKSLQNIEMAPNTKSNENSQKRLRKETETSPTAEVSRVEVSAIISNSKIDEKPNISVQPIVKDTNTAVCKSNLNQNSSAEDDNEKYNDGDGCNDSKNSSPISLDTPLESALITKPTVTDPIPPKKEKKVISVEEYLRKRIKRNVSNIKSEADVQRNTDKTSTEDNDRISVPKLESIKTENTSVIAYSNKIDDVLKTIVKIPDALLHGSHKKTSSNVNGEKNIQEFGSEPEFKNEKKIVSVTMHVEPASDQKFGTIKSESAIYPDIEKSTRYLRGKKVKTESKCSSVCSNTFSPNEISQSLDSCDQCSTSGISSCHNSSVSSLCGSPFTASDEKSNDTKYPGNGETIKAQTDSANVSLKESPFALNFDLLRKKGRHNSRRKHKHAKSKRHRKDSKTRNTRKRHRKNSSDSCYDYDSDDSDSYERRYSRKRLHSTSSSSSDRAYYSSHTERSLSPKSYHTYADWNYANRSAAPESPFLNNEVPNMFYPPLPPPWHPEYAYFHPYATNSEAPYYYETRSYERRTNIPCEAEKQKRILFVGNVEKNLSREGFTKRFSEFGEIESVKLHFKTNGNHYGFVYYARTEDVEKAMKHGNDNPNLPQYSYGYGCRKDRRDEPIFLYDKDCSPSEFVPCSHPEPDSFDLKLKQFKSELCQKKKTAQSYKFK